jgi:tetratricopeptide (TPR) repeat protein
MRKSLHLIYVIVLVATAIGCAAPVRKPLKKIVEVPEGIVKEYLQSGREYEDKGDLVAALKQYKLAMTVAPSNQEAIKGGNRVKKKLRSLAKKHYKAGRKFHKEGKYELARHQFLIALRLWPDYQEAIKTLISRKRIQIKRYVVHTIRPGETLAELAKMYYGDQHKFSIIANYNNMTDATRIYSGQKIKVPEVEGVEFLVGKKALKPAEVEVADSGFWDGDEYALEDKEQEKEPEPGVEEALKPAEVEVADSEFWDGDEYALIDKEPVKTHEAKASEDKEEPFDRVASYRDYGVDLFKNQKYQQALVAFKEVLDVNPEDSMALEYSHKIHFQYGIALFERKDYLAAKDKFEASLRYKKDCQKCHGYIKNSEDLYKELHYKKGIHVFYKELLNEAIAEWELVRAIDPDYKRVDYLISKAKTILTKIEELKESQKEQL